MIPSIVHDDDDDDDDDYDDDDDDDEQDTVLFQTQDSVEQDLCSSLIGNRE